jgi:excisionase family DNA binding protein
LPVPLVERPAAQRAAQRRIVHGLRLQLHSVAFRRSLLLACVSAKVLPKPQDRDHGYPVTTPPELLVAVIPADVAVVLLARAGLDSYRRAHRGENPRVDQALIELTTVALRYRTMADRGQSRAPGADSGSPSRFMSTTQAADRLRVSTRTVRRAITAGTLPAVRVGNAWLIDRDDVDTSTLGPVTR